ncbi:MAG: DUF1805 domain-containing protein [Thermoprotei archaeon]|nr:MAG: DUF1805 domain-containing protein [Thermoprotei archaeon]
MHSTQSDVLIRILRVNGKSLVGIKVELPNAPPLLVVKGEKGFVMCGYLNMHVVEELGVLAAIVKGISSIDELLEKEIAESTSKAREHGIFPGAKVKQILDRL